MTSKNTEYLFELYRNMAKYFSLEELQKVTFYLSVDWDNLLGSTKSTKLQALILLLARLGRLSSLREYLQQERPNVAWSEVPAAHQQIEDIESWPLSESASFSSIHIEGNLGPIAAIGPGASITADRIAGRDMIIYEGVQNLSVNDLLKACQTQVESVLYDIRYKYNPNL